MLVNQNQTSLRTLIQVFTANKQPAEGLVFNSPGLAIHYRRPSDANWQALSLVAGGASYTTGGFRGYGGNVYELCWPDVAIVSGQSTAVRVTYDGAYTYDVIDARLPGLELLSSLIEDDGSGENRFKAKALEQADGGELLASLVEDDGSGNNRLTQKALENTPSRTTVVASTPASNANRQWPTSQFGAVPPDEYYYSENWSIVFNSGIPASIANGEKLMFAIKTSGDLHTINDDASILLVQVTIGTPGASDGLVRINGDSLAEASAQASWASVIYEDVPDVVGVKRVRVTVKDDATALISPGTYHMGIKIVGESDVLVQTSMSVKAPIVKAIS